jgi:hypothetical protein
MKKKLLLILLTTTQLIWAQDTIKEWDIGGTSRLNFSQLSLTNWSAGGQNSINTNTLISIHANKKKDKSLWQNFLELGYGTNRQGNGNWIKTDDKIDFTSKYGYKINSKFSYAALLNFKTQFSNGFNYPNDSVKISGLFAPAYILESIGIDYQTENGFSSYFSPATIKITIVGNQDLANDGAFGVEPAQYSSDSLLIEGKNERTEFGAYLRMHYQKDIIENINVNSKLELYGNYLQNPFRIDINYELLVAFKINKYISASLSAQVLYDHDILIEKDSNNDGINDISEQAIQFKEVFGLGLAYTF